MTDAGACSFLFHHSPPPEFGADPLLLCASPEGKVEAISLEGLSRRTSPIITHSFSLLVDWFRRKSLPLPRTVVDLELAKKLIVGRPKSDFGAEAPWDMASMLLDLVPSQYDPLQIRAALTTHMAKPAISDFGNLRWMVTVAANLPGLWAATRHELEQKMEIRRFEDVEVPAYNAMLAAQYRGMNIDTAARDAFLQSIDEEYFFAHHELAIRQKVDVDRAFVDIDYLSTFIKRPLRATDLFSPPRDVIDTRKNSDPVCSLLHGVDSARENKRILLRTGGDDGRCFPLYDTLGTVTGRIMAVDPHLQHMNKKYRRVIVPSAEHRLVYVDYSQFEPNIMASISNDSLLSALCSDGDLYERLSIELCGSGNYRDIVKMMFLAYSYGKQASSLVDFLIGSTITSDEAEGIIEKRFLPLFVGIEEWKSTVEDTLSNGGRIGTLLGNHRYRTKEGDLDDRERRWAVSQLIQGTGSLILKKVIIMAKQKLPEVSVVLPMHDALLVEVPSGSAAEVTGELLGCFRDAFLDVCPFASPAVRVKPFAETQPSLALVQGF